MTARAPPGAFMARFSRFCSSSLLRNLAVMEKVYLSYV
jgi:hypothetical protein